jgi:hypothetical protein
MKLIEGMPVYSRLYKEKVTVRNGMFFAGERIVNDDPSDHDVDILCDDMFFEEFGMEPNYCTVSEIAEMLLGDMGNSN